MDRRLSLVTLGVADLDRSRRFYEGLGWTPGVVVDGEVVFFQAGPIVIGLWRRKAAADEEDLAVLESPETVHGGITLAQNQPSKAAVDLVLAEAERAGATIRRRPADTAWGGYAGSFADPDGHVWEIAWNPHFGLRPDGLKLPRPES